MSSAVQDIIEIILLLRIEGTRLFIKKELAETDHRVERRPQFMRHIGQKLALRPAGSLNGLLHALTLSDVADHARHPDAILRFQRAEADLHWKLGAVFSQTVKLQPRSH